ncbi:MAG: energy-coupling factor transporter transmembrane protein EcfT [Nocardioides sp.]|nr:energy-coupling factor transporter transmembrane protein EcfT [Nocardioides sp.]
MSQTTLLGNYRPGTTVLHRMTPGAKLGLLAVTAIVLVLFRSPPLALGALAVAVALTTWTAGGLRAVRQTLRRIAFVAVMLGAWLAWQKGWPRAVDSVGDLLALVLLSSVLTATTAVDDMLDTITRGVEPFRRFGVSPERVALVFSLTIRAIPTTLEIAHETRDAAVARGLQRSPRARLIPLVIRVVANARSTGAALHARGIGDD